MAFFAGRAGVPVACRFGAHSRMVPGVTGKINDVNGKSITCVAPAACTSTSLLENGQRAARSTVPVSLPFNGVCFDQVGSYKYIGPVLAEIDSHVSRNLENMLCTRSYLRLTLSSNELRACTFA